MAAGLMKKLSGRVGVALARPGEIDDGIDHDIGDMDALGSQFARHRLGEDALSGLGRREAGKIGSSAQGGGVAGHDDRA